MLKNGKRRHISAVGAPIWTKFGSVMQNDMQITGSGRESRSRPEVEFQYGSRLFFKNGSSYISAINWDMSTKYGLLIDFDLLKAAMSTNAKPEIVSSGRGRHLDKAIFPHCCSDLDEIRQADANKMQITGKWSWSEPEVGFQYVGRLFFHARRRYISAINWYSLCWPFMSTKFGLLIDFDLLKARTSTNTKPEVVSSKGN